MRIAIVEDNRDLLNNVSAIINREPDYEVIGKYLNAEEALECLDEELPDLFIVDLGLPTMPGIELIKIIKTKYPAIDVIAFTGTEDRKTILAVIKSGASGYIVKGSTPADIINAINELEYGGAPMSPRVSRVVLSEVRENGYHDYFILSPREKEILEQIKEGLTYKEIGELYCISPHTVHSHVKKLFNKLGATDRKDALQKAMRKGLI
ncbi:MAG: response regulator transcription factor [Deltaproteobacteria bacterium]|nr:response regulator transcription factor [Deltaproteobacteria bacterium]